MNPWIIIAAVWVPLIALTACLALKRYRKTPAPAPVPGPAPASPGEGGDAAGPPGVPMAPPPSPAHISGPVSFMVYGWECGCELDFDGTGRVIWATGCGHPDGAHGRFDDWLKGLTDDQH